MMKKDDTSNYTRRITIRLKPEEFTRIENAWKASIYRKLSEYTRRVLLAKPVIVNYRNQSTDDLLARLNGIKNELSAIGNNFNQAVHKLHTLDTAPQVLNWAIINEGFQKILLQKTEEIRQKLIQIHEQCARN